MTGYELQSPGRTGQTPDGHQSWQGALNTAEGNLEWMASFLEADEILALLAQVYRTDDALADNESLEHRIRYLEFLIGFHEELLAQLEARKMRLEQIGGSHGE